MAAARSLVIVTHVNPDGDALGSMAALARAAEQAGKQAKLIVPEDCPPRYAFLLEGLTAAGPDCFAEAADVADAVVVVDTCALAQLEDVADALAACHEKVAVIDHHATRDVVGAVQWADTTAAAAGVMVGELLDCLGWPVGRPVAEALVTAVATDTGWMRFSNTDSRSLRLLARWLDTGVQVDELYRRIFQSDRPERLRLLAAVLEGMELRCGGRLAVMTARREDFRRTGARYDETENLINEAMRIGSVEAAIMLVEQDGGLIRASLRSRGHVDVAALAQQFGGGGHARAAGCRGEGTLEDVRRRLVRAFEAVMASK